MFSDQVFFKPEELVILQCVGVARAGVNDYDVHFLLCCIANWRFFWPIHFVFILFAQVFERPVESEALSCNYC